MAWRISVEALPRPEVDEPGDDEAAFGAAFAGARLAVVVVFDRLFG
jgi:hypothetical protein